MALEEKESVLPEIDLFDFSDINSERIKEPIGGNTNLEYIDGDTYKILDGSELGVPDNTTVRTKGDDTLEKSHFLGDEAGTIKRGDIGGDEYNAALKDLLDRKGFNQPVLTSETDETGSRVVGDLADENGNLFSDYKFRHGLTLPTVYSTDSQLEVYLVGALDRARREFNDEVIEEDELAKNLNKALGFGPLHLKPLAINEREYASNPGLYRDVMVRHNDRTMMNEASSIFTTALDISGSGMAEGVYAGVEMMGDLLNIDSWDKYGEAHSRRIKTEMAELPVIKNQTAFDEEGNWKLEGLMDFGEFVFSNAVISAPYMAMIVGGTAVGALTAPIVGPMAAVGVGLSAPAFVYAGQTYSEQPEDNKNPAVAIMSGVVQASLDRLGLEGASLSINFFSKEGKKKLIREVMKASTEELTEKAAEKLITQSMSATLRGMTKEVKKSLAQEIGIKQLLRAAPVAVGRGAVSEGLTESAQEIIGYVGSLPEEFDKTELTNRLLNAAVAGSTLGGAFSGVSVLSEYASARDVITAAEEETRPGSLTFKLREEEQERLGKVRTIEELNAEFDKLEIEYDLGEGTLSDLAKNAEDKRARTGMFGRVKNYFDTYGIIGGLAGEGLKSLGKAYVSKSGTYNGKKTTIMRDLFSSLGAYKVNSGAHDEIHQQILNAAFDAMLGTEAESVEAFNGRSTKEISNIMYDSNIRRVLLQIINGAEQNKISIAKQYEKLKKANPEFKLDADGTYDADTEVAVINLLNKISLVAETRTKKGSQIDTKTLLDSRVINKIEVSKRKDEFIQLLMNEGFTAVQANRAFDELLESPDMNTIEDLFNPELTVDDFFSDGPAVSKRGVELDVKNNPAFNEFLDDNLFFNIASDNAKAASILNNQKFHGTRGRKLAAALKAAVKAGEITQEEAEILAMELNDYLKARSGRFGRVENDFLRKTQENALFFTTLNQLPLATFASLVELALVSRLLTRQEIFGVLKNAGKALAYELADFINEGTSKVGLTSRKDFKEGGRKALAETGYLLQQQGARQKAGMDPFAGRKNQFMNGFFKAIGLQSLTNFTRNLRLAIAHDAIIRMTEEYLSDPNSVAGREALETLISLGVDPNILINADQEAYNEIMMVASINFTDAAVAHPRVGNRPKFYSNRSLAMLTAFQGFIGTFTATILPSIYKGLISRRLGNKIDSVRTIALLIALGFMAQALKDLIKYGDTPEWLDDEELFQRAIYSSGLLGSAERVIDLAYPLYPQRTSGPIAGVGTFLEGEMPAVSYGLKLGDVFKEAVSGDTGEFAKAAVRAAPIVGPSYSGAQAAKEIFGDD